MQTFDPLAAAYDAETRHTRRSGPWELCHEASKIHRRDLSVADAAVGDRIQRGELLRQEERAERISRRAPTASSFYHGRPRVSLPLVEPGANDPSFAELVARRRSTGAFSGAPLSIVTLADLLFCAGGVTHVHPGSGVPLRAAPCSGALYELEFYVAARAVEGLPAALYHYHAASHTLAKIAGRDARRALEGAAAVPALVEGAAVYVLIASVIGRLEWKYAQRAYRFTLLNAGHAAQQLCLAAAGRGLGACPHGGFVDDEVAQALGIDGVTELVVHGVCVGEERPRAVARPTSAAPRLRRFDPFHLPRRWADWPALEVLAVEALRGRDVANREALLRLRALLPGDRSVLDYTRALDDPAVDLECDASAVFAFPVRWDEARRTAWRACVDTEGRRVRDWLGTEATPRAFVDLSSSAETPRTENAGRWLHRRVVFSADVLDAPRPEASIVRHELAHAAYLPHHRVVAEGIAGVVGDDVAEGVGVPEELRGVVTPAALSRWLRGAPLRGVPETLHPALAAVLVARLCRHRGRSVFLEWTAGFLYPATPAERAAVFERFESLFGAPLERVVEDGWACR